MAKRANSRTIAGRHPPVVGPLLGSVVGHALHRGVPHLWLPFYNEWILQSKQQFGDGLDLSYPAAVA
jgi:hypothetical protein